MRRFMDKNFMLESETAVRLYEKYAKDMPVIDYHCHISPREIYEDRRFKNITELWLEGDHYKWRLMRFAGVDEYYITGAATAYEKFCKYAEVLPEAIGNPLYHWSHMELKKYFGYDGLLSRKTADDVWTLCNRILTEKELSVREIIRQSNVEIICTTDDPADDLMWHRKLKETDIETKVYPAWRPDKLLNIEFSDFTDYIKRFAEAAGENVCCWDSLKTAILKRMDYFDANGCVVSDHGLLYVPYEECSDKEADVILKKALRKEHLTLSETEKYRTRLMLFLGEEYCRRRWVMQLHYGCERNINSGQYDKLGADTGYDCISNYAPSHKLTALLDALAVKDRLPKTILYSLNPSDNAVIDSIIGGFQNGTTAGKIQHGSAWWFNDNKSGMEMQLTSLAQLGVLGTFVGMLTDSRSFLSYTRHDYFRRILCNLLGGWVEAGEYPQDETALERVIRGISHDNAQSYFDFK